MSDESGGVTAEARPRSRIRSRLPRSPGRLGSVGELTVRSWMALTLAWFIPLFFFDRFTPWFVMAVAALPLGLTTLGTMVRSRDRVAWLSATWVVWALIAAAFSSSPWLSIRGAAGRDYSVLILLVLLGMYAIGRRLSDKGVAVIGPTFAVAMAVGTAVGTFQIVHGVSQGMLVTFEGRASGLSTNPVFYGSLMSGLVGYAAARVVGRFAVTWLAALALGTYGVTISGSRVAMAAAVIVVIGAVVAGRGAAWAWIAASASFGGALGAAVMRFADATNPVDRLAVGADGRTEVWRYAWHAWLDRPVTGWGLGLFRDGVQGRFSAEFVRTHTAGGEQPWGDPHNIVVLLLVSTGIVGLAIALAFGWLAIKAAHGPLLLLFVGVALSWLFQPTPIVVAPFALLVLGAAHRHRWVTPSGAVPMTQSRSLYAGALIGAFFALGDAGLVRTVESPDAAGARTMELMSLGDPRVSGIISDTYLELAAEDPSILDDALHAAQRATSLEPSRPFRWVERADIELRLGDYESAQRSIDRALQLEPNSRDAWLGLAVLSEQTGDAEQSASALARACELTEGCGG